MEKDVSTLWVMADRSIHLSIDLSIYLSVCLLWYHNTEML